MIRKMCSSSTLQGDVTVITVYIVAAPLFSHTSPTPSIPARRFDQIGGGAGRGGYRGGSRGHRGVTVIDTGSCGTRGRVWSSVAGNRTGNRNICSQSH